MSRKTDEIVTIGDNIRITVLGIQAGKVRLGIEAPESVPVHRGEIYEAIQNGGSDRKAK